MPNSKRAYTYYQSSRPKQEPEPAKSSHNKPTEEDAEKPKRRWLKYLLISLLLVAVVLAGYASWVSYKLFTNTPKVFGGTPTGNILTMLQPTKLKGEESGPVNVLIAGNSVDDPNHGGADLTDSIMIMRIDPQSHKIALISIPRDLWVNIPGTGYRKINEAYHWGGESDFAEPGYAPGGMGLLEKTISDSFDIPISYYVLINYGALKNLVDAVGGVDVVITSTDDRGLYDPNIQASDGGPLLLANGPQHLDGQTALNLARARGNPPPDGRVPYGFERGDFKRTENQRLLLSALQTKLLSTKTLTNPVTVGKVFDALGNNVQTDLKINEAWRIASVFRKKDTSIRSEGLTTGTKGLLVSYRSPTGQSALIPAAGINDYSEIIAFIKSL